VGAKKYKKLIGKHIDVMFYDKAINSYVITEIIPTVSKWQGWEHRGQMYKCPVEWENKEIAKDYPYMDFDVQTLDDLIKTGEAQSPMMANMSFVVQEEKHH
jgi:hypothetical protein